GHVRFPGFRVGYRSKDTVGRAHVRLDGQKTQAPAPRERRGGFGVGQPARLSLGTGTSGPLVLRRGHFFATNSVVLSLSASLSLPLWVSMTRALPLGVIHTRWLPSWNTFFSSGCFSRSLK